MTSRRWVFTLNNYSQDEYDIVTSFCMSINCKYAVVGKEVGETGTPHLQGFVILESPQRLPYCRANLSPRGHYERARATSAKAATYCKKEGDWQEFGDFPGQQGKRSDIDDFVEWVKSAETTPTSREIAREYPSLYLRYSAKLMELVTHIRPPVDLVTDIELRTWQEEARTSLEADPDDRSVWFFVDPEGGKGKSTLVRYMISKQPEKVQVLMIGKRDDLSFAIDPSKTIFLFDIPRGNLQYLQYSVLEMLKNQMIFSGKYASSLKILESKVHVYVFTNEEPDYSTMTADRYHVVHI